MNQVYGFTKETKLLVNNYHNKSLANSIIFSGQKGIGKNTFIINFLKEVFKSSVNKNQVHHHLNLIDNNTHPNIRYLTRDYDYKLNKEKTVISIDQIRKLNNFFYESTFDDLPKFIIIDSADDLNVNSSNSLLKILEESRKKTFIFLISHQPSSLLPTIRSRCLKFVFKNHNFETFKIILKDKIDIDNEESLKFLFDISNGSPGIGLKLQDEEIYYLYENILNSLIENEPLSKHNVDLSLKVSKFNNDKFKIFLSLLKFILINLNKIQLGINILDQYLSNNLVLLEDVSKKISQISIFQRLDYLINNENDLFAYNLDKNYFILNFFAKFENKK